MFYGRRINVKEESEKLEIEIMDFHRNYLTDIIAVVEKHNMEDKILAATMDQHLERFCNIGKI